MPASRCDLLEVVQQQDRLASTQTFAEDGNGSVALDSRSPRAAPMASNNWSGSRTEASSTMTRRGSRAGSVAMTSMARRVLPMPPGPVRVRSLVLQQASHLSDLPFAADERGPPLHGGQSTARNSAHPEDLQPEMSRYLRPFPMCACRLSPSVIRTGKWPEESQRRTYPMVATQPTLQAPSARLVAGATTLMVLGFVIGLVVSSVLAVGPQVQVPSGGRGPGDRCRSERDLPGSVPADGLESGSGRGTPRLAVHHTLPVAAKRPDERRGDPGDLRGEVTPPREPGGGRGAAHARMALAFRQQIADLCPATKVSNAPAFCQ